MAPLGMFDNIMENLVDMRNSSSCLDDEGDDGGGGVVDDGISRNLIGPE